MRAETGLPIRGEETTSMSASGEEMGTAVWRCGGFCCGLGHNLVVLSFRFGLLRMDFPIETGG